MNINKQIEKFRINQLNDHLESSSESEDVEYKCEECGDTKPKLEMKFTHPHVDSGCCNDCAEDYEIASLWGFNDVDD